MGYITMEVESEGIDHTWNFFYGEYVEDKWVARLADYKLRVFHRFEAESIENCFDLLAEYLNQNAVVIDIFGNKMEHNYIEMLNQKMDIAGRHRLRSYF